MAISITPLSSTSSAVVWSDVNLGLNQDSQYDLVYDEQSVKNSVITILGTRVGTRVFRRDFGSNLEGLLWDPMDDITIGSIKTEMIRAINLWEPRILLTLAEVKPDYPNEQYFCRLSYTIPSLNNKAATFVFNLSQTR